MVEVVVARLAAPAPALDAMSALLCDEERRRASRMRPERHRRRFIVARARLREFLAARLGEPPEAIELVRGPCGKPQLAPRFAASGWRFNVSHCEEVAVYAFARATEVGVDVEQIRPFAEADEIALRFFSPRERRAYFEVQAQDRPAAFFRCWTRKEAFVKALGQGLGTPLEAIDVSVARAGWCLENFCPVPGFIAALAARRA